MAVPNALIKTMDESAIVEGLKSGSSSAANELVERFGRPLIRYFSVHLPDPSVAEDMAQEVFLRLVTSVRRGGVHDIKSLASLVFTIARNLAFDVRKAGDRRPRWESLDEHWAGPGNQQGPVMLEPRDLSPSPRDRVAALQESERIEGALRRLPAEMREVVVMRHIEGLSGQEIAGILGIAHGTVWSRLNRGLQELKLILQESQTRGQG